MIPLEECNIGGISDPAIYVDRINTFKNVSFKSSFRLNRHTWSSQSEHIIVLNIERQK